LGETIINSVKKALNILDILAFEDFENKGIGLSDLSKMTGLKPNTLHNILRTMVICGYVQQYENLKYAAGPKCRSIGLLNRFAPGLPLCNKIEKLLSALSKKIGEAVVFAVLVEGNRIPIVICDNDNVIKVDYRKLEQKNIYSLVTGRVLAAFADENGLKLIKEKWGYPGKEWKGIDNDTDLNEAFRVIKENGVAKELDRYSLFSVAVPALGDNGEIASIGCYAPIFRCDDNKQLQILNELKKAALEIERNI